jgi:hypothetical protein
MTESGCNTRYNARLFYGSILDEESTPKRVSTFVNELNTTRSERNIYDRERPKTTWFMADDTLAVCVVEWWDY